MKSCFEKNLSYLQHFDRALYERFKSMEIPPSVRVIPAKSGAPTLRAISADGADILVHSEHDPVKEAEKFVETRILGKTDGYAIAGFGLGYHAIAFANALPASKWLFVIEAREDIFRAALEYLDLSPLLTRKNTGLYVGNNFSEFLGWLKRELDKSSVDDMTLMLHSSVRLLQAFYGHVSKEMASAINRRKVEVATLVRQADVLEKNVIMNLPSIARSAGVKDFDGILKGIPIIVVAAGPSLSQSLPYLKGLMGKAALICVGKSLSLLLENGIVPEFAAHLDMIPACKVCFDNLKGLKDVSLVFDPDGYYGVVQEYPCDRITSETIVPVTKWFQSFTGGKGFLEKGLSVAHTAFFFARATGANPIILVGVDLAFPGEQTHAEGTVNTWGGKVSDLKEEFLTVPSVSGGEVKTLRSFLSFITAFEVEIAKTEAAVINCSVGGASIRGAKNMSLESAVAEFCATERPIRQLVEESLAKERPFDRNGFLSAAGDVGKTLGRIEELCQESLKRLKRVSKLKLTNKYDIAEYEKLAAKVNETRKAILHEEKIIPFLQRLLSGASLQIKAVVKSLDETDPQDKQARMMLEVRRMDIFFTGYLAASKYFREQLGIVVHQFEEWR